MVCPLHILFFFFLNNIKKYNIYKGSKGAKIRNRYNQVPQLTQDINGKVTNSQLDTTNESQQVNPFPAGDHKAHINRHEQRHSNRKTEKHKRSTKEVPPGGVSKIFSGQLKPGLQRANLTLNNIRCGSRRFDIWLPQVLN